MYNDDDYVGGDDHGDNDGEYNDNDKSTAGKISSIS